MTQTDQNSFRILATGPILALVIILFTGLVRAEASLTCSRIFEDKKYSHLPRYVPITHSNGLSFEEETLLRLGVRKMVRDIFPPSFSKSLSEFPHYTVLMRSELDLKQYLDDLSEILLTLPERLQEIAKPSMRRLAKLVTELERTIEDQDLHSDRNLALIERVENVANLAKGISFEIIAHYKLLANGYEVLGRGVSSENLERVSGIYSPQTSFEIDFVAAKDGVRYLFEVKSINPYSRKISESVLRAAQQVSERKKLLNRLPDGNNWRIIFISLFDLGENARDKLKRFGADEVWYLRPI